MIVKGIENMRCKACNTRLSDNELAAVDFDYCFKCKGKSSEVYVYTRDHEYAFGEISGVQYNGNVNSVLDFGSFDD